MRRAAVAAAVLTLAAPGTAAAIEASRAELGALAREAASDPAALAELGAVTTVEGVAADPAAMLAGAEGDDLDARLAELARSARAAPPAGLPGADDARDDAAAILSNEDLAPPGPAGEPSFSLPGISLGLALLLAGGIAIVAALTARALGRSSVIERERTDAGPGPRRGRARDLHRAAAEAERAGDHAAAVRLWFRAGLADLDSLGAIRLRPSLTAAGAAREIESRTLARLARSYERVAFGDRDASARDSNEQRSGWESLLAEVRRG